MMNFLNWTIEKDFAITSPQIIAYQDEHNNVTVLPSLQFVASVEDLNELYYPVVYAVDSDGDIVWKMAYRDYHTFDAAFKFAMEQVESVFEGSYEDGILRHDALNGWAFEIMKRLEIG